jgi:hypothetical protein
MINWKHIMQEQPVDNSVIIQLFSPIEMFEGDFPLCYLIKMRKYKVYLPFDDLLIYNKMDDTPNPDFWWVYAYEFPFPKEKT